MRMNRSFLHILDHQMQAYFFVDFSRSACVHCLDLHRWPRQRVDREPVNLASMPAFFILQSRVDGYPDAELRERFAADAAVSERETIESGKAVPLVGNCAPI